MDERQYYPRRAYEQEPPQRQYNEAPPDFTHTPRPTEPRQRYRATQYEHPMYDEVEDDDHGYSEQLDAFDEYVLQQPLYDRQQQASQGLARLSFAPASSRTDQARMMDTDQFHPQMQQVYHQTYRERDRYFDIGEAVPGYMGRHAYPPNQPKDSSSDIPYGGSSSPALNASRRQATQYPPRQAPQLPVLPDRLSGSSNLRDDEYQQRPRKTKLQSTSSQRESERSYQQRMKLEPTGEMNSSVRATPVIQGIPLVPVSALPDRVRTVFPYPTFNAVQSKCFEQVYRSDNNFVLSSPTGSGKTAILELAICRAVATNSTDQYKVVYQAPTKALCAERQRDWDKKFTQLGLRCAELTGDSDASDLRNVQSANIIITTPEKWDSMTRKWKDHERLMRLVKLFLVDEVHILNENRGAVLEAVVSRMKSIGTEVRFVALSATVPNLCDVAAWLGKTSSETYLPSPNEKFGEEFRPVKLKKHVCGYMSKSNNDWAFEKQLDDKLPSVIAKYSERKPMMIFCATRKSCIATAKLIANWWKTSNGKDNLWKPPSKPLAVQDKEVRDLVAYGVAFHHAGLGHEDRSKVEAGFLQGDISVICCTSTLAVGVNLPCHLVIVKNTMSWTQEGFHEYSDLEMMQMLGRAGRPQFDSSAVAVIMTRQNKVRRYETLVTGQEILESRLHLNLIDHMNAEIGLGTIRDLDSARTWLTGTFLYVRLLQNPTYYKLEGSRSGQSIREQVDDICFRDINLLKEHNLAVGEERFRSTEFGHAMARYYVQFETMKVFMGLQPKSALSEVLSAVAQAVEFSTIRFRQGEKSLYKMINQSPSIRFPIPVNLDLPAQKVSIIIQSVLGHAEISWDGDTAKHRATYTQEVATIFKSINSLIRCIIDCQIVLGDSVTIHNALMLERSLGSRAWDDSPMQMIQIPEIGNVSVRKLVNAGIRGIEDLEATEARRIETILGKSPPFGLKMLDALKSFPKLRVSLGIQQTSTAKTQEGIKIQVSADIGFMNQRPPERFANKLVYVCMLAETSDGRKVHFTRISGHKLGVGQKLVFPALLTSADQTINCYLMCEGIAGSMRYASITPKIAPSLFPLQNIAAEPTTLHKPNMSRRRTENVPMQRKPSAANTSDNYDDADLDDEALVQATREELSFDHIDNYANPVGATAGADVGKDKSIKIAGPTKPASAAVEAGDDVPTQLPNGKWLCNHNCKDKKTCKHYCCKHGMDKPPKKAAPKRTTASSHQEQPSTKSSTQEVDKTQTKLQPTALKRKKSMAIEELDLTQQEKKRKTEYAISGPRDFRALHKLHKSVQKTEVPSSLHSVMHKTPQYRYGGSGEHQLSCLSQSYATRRKSSSEYGDLDIDGFVSDHSAAHDNPLYGDATTSLHFSPNAPVTTGGSETFGDDDSTFGDAMVGLADSQDLRMSGALNSSVMQDASANNALNMDDFLADIELPDIPTDPDVPEDALGAQAHDKHREKPYHYPNPFLEATSSPKALRYTRPATPAPQRKATRSPLQSTHNPAPPQPASSDEPDGTDVYSDLLSLLDTPPTSNKENIATKQNAPISPARPQPTTTDENSPEQKPKEIPDAFKDLQPWLFQQFGDVVELVSE